MLEGIELPTVADVTREIQRRKAQSLAEFAKMSWHIIEPTSELKWGWALDAICEHLEAVTDGRIKRLLINVPPGSMKSLLTGVIWPAWEWGPKGLTSNRFLGTAHKQELAVRDNMKCRRLIESQWYQSLWPVELTGDQNAKTKFENKSTGFREAMAFTSMTGSRGDRVILDDPHSVDDAYSKLKLESGVRTFKEALPSRVNNTDSAIVIIMQRLHSSDVSAHAKELGYVHLCIPMRYEGNKNETIIGWSDPRTEVGELFFPERFNEADVAALELSLGTYAAAGQLQQRPAPADGGIIKMSWFKRYDHLPNEQGMIVQSWDTAFKAQQHNDPSVCTTWLYVGGKSYLMDVFRKRMEYPDLKRAFKSQAMKYEPQVVIIEDKASGQSLIQELRLESTIPIIAIKPEADKITRISTQTAAIEAGLVFLPNSAPWLPDFETELASFPLADHDDQVDSVSQYLKWIQTKKTAVLPRIRAL